MYMVIEYSGQVINPAAYNMDVATLSGRHEQGATPANCIYGKSVIGGHIIV